MSRPDERADPDLRDPVLERLGEGADPSPARRQTLVDRIAAGDAEAPRPARRRRGVWWIGAAAAVAAAVVAAVLLRPAEPDPIPPTALFEGLLGPLPTLATSEPAPPDAARPDSPATDALFTVWQDLKEPLSIVAQAASGRRAFLEDDRLENEPVRPAPAGESVTKEN